MKKRDLYSDKAYWLAKTQIELYGQLDAYMKSHNMNRTQLAEKLGVSKGYISQVLNGDFDHRISKLFEMALAIGVVPKIEFTDLEELIEQEEEGVKSVTWKLFPSKVQTTMPSAGTITCLGTSPAPYTTFDSDLQKIG